MAYVKDTLAWATSKTDFYLQSGITVGDLARDARLADWFLEATWKADDYMDNEFVDDDGVDISPQPPGVKNGVYDFVIACDEFFNSGAKGGNVSLVKTGQLQEAYAKSAGGSKLAPMIELALRAAAPHWHWLSTRGIIKGTL